MPVVGAQLSLNDANPVISPAPKRPTGRILQGAHGVFAGNDAHQALAGKLRDLRSISSTRVRRARGSTCTMALVMTLRTHRCISSS